MDALEAAIRRAADEAAPVRFAVALHVAGAPHPTLAIEADRVVHAASTMKLPVLVELHRRVDRGDLALDQRLTVRNAFCSIVDDSAYRLDPADDSETALYARDGEGVTLGELAHLMVTVSSNLATNLLIDLLGASAVSATMRHLGLPGLVVRRGVEDGPAFRAGLNNTVTAADLARLLLMLDRGEVVSAAASGAMLETLAAQAFNECIPAGLPPGTWVAHKTGSIDHLCHDAALVRPPGGGPAYSLVVLTTGLEETIEAPRFIARVASLCHAALGSASPGQ